MAILSPQRQRELQGYLKQVSSEERAMKLYLWRIRLSNGAEANTSIYFPADEPPEYENGEAVAIRPLLQTEIEEE